MSKEPKPELKTELQRETTVKTTIIIKGKFLQGEIALENGNLDDFSIRKLVNEEPEHVQISVYDLVTLTELKNILDKTLQIVKEEV